MCRNGACANTCRREKAGVKARARGETDSCMSNTGKKMDSPNSPKDTTTMGDREPDHIHIVLPSAHVPLWQAAVKWGVAGIVAAGLLAAWGIAYLKPILQKENELARIQNEILSHRAERQSQVNDSLALVLDAQRDSLVSARAYVDSLIEVYETKLLGTEERLRHVSRELADLSTQYAALSENVDLLESQRIRYQFLADSTRALSDSLRTALEHQKRPVIRRDRGGWGGSWR